MTVREHVMPYVLVLGGAALCVVIPYGCWRRPKTEPHMKGVPT
jgi:hypothetical protein